MTLLICLVALLASGLTFFSGFGLGTLLLPAFALFFPLPQAIAMTAVVHLLNGLFKLALVGLHADRSVALRFGVPAVLASIAGALLLAQLAGIEPLIRYSLLDAQFDVTPLKLAVGGCLLAFSLIELWPAFDKLTFHRRWLWVGGLLSGFFGGLAGMQGALRSAFLLRLGLSKEAFIATGVVAAVMIDVARIGSYWPSFMQQRSDLDWPLVAAAVLSAFIGAFVGNRLLKKITLPTLQRFVAGALLMVSVALMVGWL